MRTPAPLDALRPRALGAALVGVVVLALLATAVTLVLRADRGSDREPVRRATPVGPPTSVPDTAFEVPEGAVFLATDGDDGARGREGSPVRTLSRALALVPSGGTVVVRGGTYRDGSTASIGRPVTLQAYPHEQVWFDGADVVDGWYERGDGTWARDDWSTPDFCDGDYYDVPWDDQREDNTGPCTHSDMGGRGRSAAAGSPQMLFLDGAAVREVADPDDLEEGTFAYDQESRRVLLGSDPRGRLVEMAARPMALRFEGGPGGAVVRGLGFRRYATNEHNGSATHGAVLSNDSDGRFEDNAFTQMAAAGLSLANARRSVVSGNRFVDNGFNGFDANGSSTVGRNDDLVLADNVFEGNNAARFGVDCKRSCAAAAVKLAHVDGLTVRDNVFSGTREGAGLWCDLDCSRAVITGNVFRDNEGPGLYYEVSSKGLIADNLMVGNRDYGLKSGSAQMRIYHNTLVDNGTNVLLYDDDRSPGVDGWDDIGPDTVDNEFVNNVLVGGAPSLSAWRTSSDGDNTGPGTFVVTLDANTYARRSGGDDVLVDWRTASGTTGYDTLESFTDARGYEAHGQELSEDDPLFVDAGDGDYRVGPDSPASGSGRPLPEDVAEALGVRPGAVLDRGAVSVLRSPA